MYLIGRMSIKCKVSGFDPLYHAPTHNNEHNTVLCSNSVCINTLFLKCMYTNKPHLDQEMTLSSVSIPPWGNHYAETYNLPVCKCHTNGIIEAKLSSFTQNYNQEAHPRQRVCSFHVLLHGCYTLLLIHFPSLDT